MRYIQHRKKGRRNAPHLSGNFWDKVGNAFTDPEAKFEFPIKPIETAFTKETENALYLTAGIFAFGIIAGALIISNKN